MLVDGGVVDIAKRTNAPDLRALLSRLDDIDFSTMVKPDYPLDTVDFLPPVPNPLRMLAVGLNYPEHVKG